MKEDGTVLFDTRDHFASSIYFESASHATQRLRDILSNLNVPPLKPAPQDNILTKAFFILSEFPSRFNGSQLWIEVSLEVENAEGHQVRTSKESVRSW